MSSPVAPLAMDLNSPRARRWQKSSGSRNACTFSAPRNDVPEILMASDLVVMPSPMKGWIRAIEALAAGRAVVDCCRRAARGSRRWGRTVDSSALGDQGAFVDAVVSLLHDRQRLRDTVATAIVAAEKFSLDTHVERLMQCYDEAADAASPHA